MNYENKDLIFKEIPTGKTAWRSPSNIALVKYWGKTGVQIPSNPSVSFTLSKSHTDTTVHYAPSVHGNCGVEFYFDGLPNEAFAEKTRQFFSKLGNIFPFVNQLNFRIYSKNSFPHSAGIASSASGMSAIALALCDIENIHFMTFPDKDSFFKKASYVARLGSGSACRSLFGGIVEWGLTDEYPESSNYYGTPLNNKINSIFENYHDSILIVDSGEKKVSSTIGHGLMNSNPFSSTRFVQANKNIATLNNTLKNGDLNSFVKLVESEALTLHSMMMTSSPYYLLMKPGTVSIIEKIWEFRNDTSIPVCFTLDAGPNVHILYPHKYNTEVQDFIKINLLCFTADGYVINDVTGQGPEKLEAK